MSTLAVGTIQAECYGERRAVCRAYGQYPKEVDAIDAPLVVIESDREIDPGTGWRLVRSKRYGSTVVHFARRNGPVGGDAVEPGTPVTGTRIAGTAVTESEQNT